MPSIPPTHDELVRRAQALLEESPTFQSLCRRRPYTLVSVDSRAGYLRVRYESGRIRRLLLKELVALVHELYLIGSLSRNYFREPSNTLRVFGRPFWHAPGAAMFAILPKLDPQIMVDAKCGLVLKPRMKAP